MGKFTKYTRSQLAGMRPQTDKAQLAAALIVIAEQRSQLKELKRLVRYQQIHIARLRAGEEIDFPDETAIDAAQGNPTITTGVAVTSFSNRSMAGGCGLTIPAPSSTGEE